MLLSCPSCEASFRVNPEALGPTGRTVRCARCQTTWFAPPAAAECEPALAEAPAIEARAAVSPVIAANDPITWHEEPAEGEAAPPLVPDGTPAAEMQADGDAERARVRKAPLRPAPRKSSRKRLGVAALAAAAAFTVMMVAARANVVRAVPDLAGLYAAVGLPVNLRGLEFRGVHTTSEVQDGITVLVIEGEVVNVARHAVEVPRVRLAVLGTGGQELYSWTALLPRSILSEDEKVAFRSRLASPPPEGREVLVRFLTRSDLTNGR